MRDELLCLYRERPPTGFQRRSQALRASLLLWFACAFACLGDAPQTRAAYDAGLAYFAHNVRRVDPSWANLFGYLHRRFGVEARSAAGEPLHRVPTGQYRAEMAAIFQRLVDPSAGVGPARIAALESQIDRLTAPGAGRPVRTATSRPGR